MVICNFLFFQPVPSHAKIANKAHQPAPSVWDTTEGRLRIASALQEHLRWASLIARVIYSFLSTENRDYLLFIKEEEIVSSFI